MKETNPIETDHHCQPIDGTGCTEQNAAAAPASQCLCAILPFCGFVFLSCAHGSRVCLCAIPVTRTLTRDASSLLLRFSSCLHAAAPGQGPAGANSRPRHTPTHIHIHTHTRQTRHRSLGRQRHTLRHINTHTHTRCDSTTHSNG